MLHQIGVGALGPVVRTYEPERDRLVAVKIFRLDITPEQAQALADELARAADASLFHPSIVEPIAAGVQGTVAYRAEEYMPAESLDVAMRHYAPAPPERVLPIATQLAGALDFARASNVGHGGLHPRDVFVTPDEVRVTGFGVVEALERVGLRAPVRRPYSAPERIAGEPWGAPADVFALAAITFELLTGRRPAGTGLAIGEIKEASAGPHAARLLAVLAKAMSDKPEDRYPTALAFAAALEAASRGEGEPAVAAVSASSTADEACADEASAQGAAAAAAPVEQEPVAPPVLQADGAEPAASLDPGNASPEPAEGPEPDVPLPRPAARPKRRRPRGSRPGQTAEPEPPLVPAAIGASEPPADFEAAFRDEEEEGFERAAHGSPALAAATGEPEPDPDRFTLDAADLVLDATTGEPSPGPVGDTLKLHELPAREDVARPESGSRGEAAAAAAAAAPRAVPAVPFRGAASSPARDLDDSSSYDPPLAVEQSGEARVLVVPQKRTAMLPLAIALVIGLPLAYAAGYMRGRAVDGPEPAAAEEQTALAADGSATGTTFSEQAIEPPPDPVPPPGASAVIEGPAAPPAAVDGPTTGRIVVRSTPSNAHVTVNGKWTGRTPLTLSDLAFGDYVVRVVSDGYRVGREEFTLAASQASRTISMRLERDPARASPAPEPRRAGSSRPTAYYGSLYVDSRPQGATVYVGGERRGTTPLRLDRIPIGSHVVRLELVDHSAWTKVVRVAAGQEARATGSLDPIR